MRMISKSGINILISEDCYLEHVNDHKSLETEFGLDSEEGEDIENVIILNLKDWLNNYFFNNPEYAKYINGRGVRQTLVIEAHGFSSSGGWSYVDGAMESLVRDLVFEYDGLYGLIVLRICNSGAHTINTNQSLLLFPDRVTGGGFVQMAEGTIFSLYDPKFKEEIDGYTIEYYLSLI